MTDLILFLEKRKTTIGISINQKADKTYRHEMFLRFFEELQIAIENKALSPEIVCYMFSYYAIVADRCDKFVSDYNDHQTWKKFKEFVKDMKKIAQQKGYFQELFEHKEEEQKA